MAEVAYNVYDTHVTRTGGSELFHKLPGVHSHGWYHQWDAAGNDSITFTGTSIRLYAVLWAHYGIATVSIDGSDPVDVDLYSADTVASAAPVWDSGTLVSEAHTVVWSWSGRKNAAAVTDTYAVVLDWFDIIPPPNANTIATGDFGIMTGRVTSVTGGYSAQVRYAADARNYLDFLVDVLTSGTSTVAINAVLDGVSTIGGDTTWAAPYLVTLPTGLGQAYVKVVAREAGNYKLFEVWVAPSATPTAWVLYLSLPLFALMGANEWSNPYALGSGYAWTDVEAAAAIVPSPPNTDWYNKNFETSLDGAYGRVTMLGTDGLPTTVYSNGADGNDSLVSLDTMEYFDPTSTLSQVNSCQFSIHTPFTKEASHTTIAAFLATFAQNQPFEVERGWMTVDDDGVEAYDIVTMGRFFVTDATLDKNQWIVNVEAQDGMGLLLDARYLNSPYGIITEPYPDDEYVPLPSGDDYVPFTPDPGGEAPGGEHLFFDDFNRADGPLGDKWSWNPSYPVVISGNKAIDNGGGAIAQTEPLTDFRVSVTFLPPAYSDSVWIIARQQSPLATDIWKDGYGLQWMTGHNITIWSLSNNREVLPTFDYPVWLTGGEVLSFQLVGNVFTVYKNDTLVASATDSMDEFTSGYAGVYMDDDAMAIDDITIDEAL